MGGVIPSRIYTSISRFLAMQATPARPVAKSRDVSSRGKFAARDTIGGRWRWMMLDVLFLALGLGFFAAGCLYLYACDRL
jgi:hypothetical protein